MLSKSVSTLPHLPFENLCPKCALSISPVEVPPTGVQTYMGWEWVPKQSHPSCVVRLTSSAWLLCFKNRCCFGQLN